MSDLAEAIGAAILTDDDGQHLDPNDPAAALDLVRRAATADEVATGLLHQAVTAARSNGHSWSAVGGALGLTRQAAQQRFGRVEQTETDTCGEAAEERWLGPVTAFDEMAELAMAGDRGWHTVHAGMLRHRMTHTLTRWEHKRLVWGIPLSRFEAEGWQVGASTFPWIYLIRDTGLPINQADGQSDLPNAAAPGDNRSR
ncbi:MAG: hypothetical protein L0H31_04080 [Nocardioidaceae bacterium]|nr:hypothetical protein [Nocardioidaceae bacterium]